MSTVENQLEHHAALDRKLVSAVKGIRVLGSIGWPWAVQQKFLDDWHRGEARLGFRVLVFVVPNRRRTNRVCGTVVTLNHAIYYRCDLWDDVDI